MTEIRRGGRAVAGLYGTAADAAQSVGLCLLILGPNGFLSTESQHGWLALAYIMYRRGARGCLQRGWPGLSSLALSRSTSDGLFD